MDGTQTDHSNNTLVWIIIVLLIVAIFMMPIALAILSLGTQTANKRVAEPVGSDSDPGSPCSGDHIQQLRANRPLLERIGQNRATYAQAAQLNNIPWEMLAGIHFREHNNDPSAPSNGEGPYQLHTYREKLRGGSAVITYHGRDRTITQGDLDDFATSSDLAANVLIEKSGGGLSPNADPATIKNAFWGYNGRVGASADDSSYVMNHFDTTHADMTRWDGVRDGRDGAYTVYYLLRYLAEYDSSGQITGFRDCGSLPPSVPGSGDDADSFIKVPAVRERTSGDCGQASVLMMALFINPDHRDDQYLEVDTNGRFWTKNRIGCVTPAYLNNRVNGSSRDWTYDDPSPTIGLAKIRRSLAAGYPVVFYGSPGLIYATKHIFVITGYDSAAGAFYVNNPFPGGCQCDPSTKSPNGRSMTEANLLSHFGGTDGTYTNSLIIRKVFR